VDQPRCPPAEELRAFALGRLPEDALGRLADHLDRCPACQRAAEVLDWADDEVTAALRGPAAPEPFLDEPEYRDLLVRAESLSATAVTADARRAADRLGPYRLGDRLGASPTGAVYAAVDERTGAAVAVKVLSAPPTDPEGVVRFLRDAERLAQLDHPNLVRTTDAGEDAGEVYLVTEAVAGLDAAALVRRSGPLPVREGCEVARQAAQGLAHAHRHGLAHRDVKPANLLLTPDGVVKLLDLGPAAAASASDARTDVYNLGYTLYHLLTGRPPVGVWRLDAPEPVAAVVGRMVAPDPPGRRLTAADVAENLAPFAAGADLAALLAAVPTEAVPLDAPVQIEHGVIRRVLSAVVSLWRARHRS
jgi:hypothetical protein